MDYSCSAFLIYAGINRDLKDKVHLHNVIFAEDFRGNIDDIFEGRLPKDFYISLFPPLKMRNWLLKEKQVCTF